MLVAMLAELGVAVAEVRDAQRHVAEASAARAAAERLHAAACARPSRAWSASAKSTARPHRQARTATDLSGLDFPDGPSGPKPDPKYIPQGPHCDGQEQNLTRFDAGFHGQMTVKRSTARLPRGWPSRLPVTLSRGGRI
jgi:hypothetical protein